MRNFPGGAIAAGVLCAIAATVAVWSGPLASATAELHAAVGKAGSHAAQTHLASATPRATSTVAK